MDHVRENRKRNIGEYIKGFSEEILERVPRGIAERIPKQNLKHLS